MPKLENWEMFVIESPFAPISIKSIHLTGKIYGHSKFEDGEIITTSMVVFISIKEGRAETYSGSKYTLCKPNAEWIKWLKENGQDKYIEDLLNLSSAFIN